MLKKLFKSIINELTMEKVTSVTDAYLEELQSIKLKRWRDPEGEAKLEEYAKELVSTYNKYIDDISANNTGKQLVKSVPLICHSNVGKEYALLCVDLFVEGKHRSLEVRRLVSKEYMDWFIETFGPFYSVPEVYDDYKKAMRWVTGKVSSVSEVGYSYAVGG